MIGEDFGPCVPTGVRVLATEKRKSHRFCDARVLRLREHVRAQGQKTAEGAASAVCTHAMAIKHPKIRVVPVSSIHD